MKKIINIVFVLTALLVMSSCYEEQHFTLPGPYGDDTVVPDTMIFPFDSTRQAGIYLIKNGVVDFSRVGLSGFTDFHPEMGDSTSWYQGDGFYGSVQHWNFYPLDTKDHYGRYDQSYQSVRFTAKPFLELGPGKKYYIYTKMSFNYMAGTAPWFWFGSGEGDAYTKRHIAGFDGGSGFNGYPVFFANFAGQLINASTWPTCTEMYSPDEPFELEIVVVDYYVYFRMGGRVIWAYNLPHTVNSLPLHMVPWRNSVKFYDFYLEGDYHELDYVSWQHEKGYLNTQVPSLTKVANNDILLFAEGHVKNFVFTKEQAKAEKRSNASAIVMKRSTDQGTTWSEWTTLVGGVSDPSVNMKPVSVTTTDGVTNLLYTLDRSGYLSGDNGIYRIVSTNNGQSWSAPVEIPVNLAEYSVSTVSGHGIETADGRLIIPISAVKGNDKTVATLYSDDKGTTWHCGAVVPDADAKDANVVELQDGRLMMLISHVGTTTKRKTSYSNDGGKTWSGTGYCDITFGSGTGGYGYRYQGTTLATASGELIHCTPTGQVPTKVFNNLEENTAHNAPIFTQGVNITRSTDNGVVWTKQKSMLTMQTYTGFYFCTGAMDAILLDDGKVLCVTEGGVKIATEGLLSFKQ